MPFRATPSASITKTCWIPQNLQQEMEDLARLWYPLEVGGVIAGYWNNNAAVLTSCIGPGNNAKHDACAFLPDHAFHEREIARLYAASSGTEVYLGDWHTHPSGASRLSSLDKRTLRAIGDAPEARCSAPLMVLLAGSKDAWSTHVFTLGPERTLHSRKIVPAELRLF